MNSIKIFMKGSLDAIVNNGNLRKGFQKTMVFRHYHLTTSCPVGQQWREKKGLPANPNAYGPLTDRPDYHFIKDGRKAPPGSGKVKRVKEQRAWMERIMALTSQVDFAVERYEKIVKEKEKYNAGIIFSKLKPKGNVPSASDHNK